MKRATAYALFGLLGIALCAPATAKSKIDTGAPKTHAQKLSEKSAKQYNKQLHKAQKKQMKAQKKQMKQFNKTRPERSVTGSV